MAPARGGESIVETRLERNRSGVTVHKSLHAMPNLRRYRMERNVADILNFPSRGEKLNSKSRCRRSRFLRGVILHQILNYTIASKVIFKERCRIERGPKARIRINSFCQQQEVYIFSIL